jgi:hypothetical protein
MDRKPRSGRPRLSSVREDRILERICKRNRFSNSTDLSVAWEGSTGVKASASIVRRRLCSLGLKASRPVKKPLLTRVMKKKRLQWARNHSEWTREDWRKVLFTDESRFCLHSDHPTLVRRRSDEATRPDCLVRTTKHPLGVMVWGSFSYSGIGRLKFVKGTMGSKEYEEIVRKEVLLSARDLFPEGEWILQQDLAPCHTSKKVRIYNINAVSHFINGV